MTVTHRFSWHKSQTKSQRKFYTTWENMKIRCNKPNSKHYHNYGGRWIKCMWATFEQFRDDMREPFIKHCRRYWLKNTTIDRIDNNWNYCKENCRRATIVEQGNNKRNNKIAIIDWKEYHAKDIMNMLWISEWAAQNRISQYLKWKMRKERVFSKEKLYQERKKYNIEWELYDIYRLMQECDIPLVTAENRLRHYQNGSISKEILFHKWKMRNRKSI